MSESFCENRYCKCGHLDEYHSAIGEDIRQHCVCIGEGCACMRFVPDSIEIDKIKLQQKVQELEEALYDKTIAAQEWCALCVQYSKRLREAHERIKKLITAHLKQTL